VTTAWLVSTLRIVKGNRVDMTSGGTAAWRPGEEPTTPYRKKKSACNEMDFDRFFGKA
jgi:hypothetical protein